MTPKEKAIELRFRYWRCIDIDGIDAKRCALIAVEELIEQCEFDVIHDIGNERYIDKLNYWDKVKEEIKKL